MNKILINALILLWLGCGTMTNRAENPENKAIDATFCAVLRDGDPSRLRQALEAGAPVNGQDSSGNTPLMLAAVYGDLACMKVLLEKGAEVNATNAAGATPLMRAAFDEAKARLLVERGANVNARSALGNTPLMLAARPVNSHATVDLLLAKGAEAQATNNAGATALMAAAAAGDAISVRLLLQHGADASAQPGTDPVRFVLGGGRSALMWAAYRGNLEVMRLLVESGADVNGEGFAGTPLTQAVWANHTEAARWLIEQGAVVDRLGQGDGFAALHWAASSEESNPDLVKLLLSRGANPNLGGGEPVPAFQGVAQTPLMLARKRGETPIVTALRAAGATNETKEEIHEQLPVAREAANTYDRNTVREAIRLALPPLQKTSLVSKKSFVQHASHQDCTSCHQQFLPLAALGIAKKQHIEGDREAESQLIQMVLAGDLKNPETDWQTLFHPEPAFSKGFALFGYAAEELPANETTDAWVHHLTAVQNQDGRWLNNLPRPPMQTSDVGSTALAIHALRRYPLPGRKEEMTRRIQLARQWLWTGKPENNDDRTFQILGLAWAGEPAERLAPLVKTLLAQQGADGGWAQLKGLGSDAYATGEAIYALRVGGGLAGSHPAMQRGVRYLLSTQLADGTWWVHRRAFPFQPMMHSGFPHSRDSWISASGSSWAVIALSLPDEVQVAIHQP